MGKKRIRIFAGATECSPFSPFLFPAVFSFPSDPVRFARLYKSNHNLPALFSFSFLFCLSTFDSLSLSLSLVRSLDPSFILCPPPPPPLSSAGTYSISELIRTAIRSSKSEPTTEAKKNECTDFYISLYFCLFVCIEIRLLNLCILIKPKNYWARLESNWCGY